MAANYESHLDFVLKATEEKLMKAAEVIGEAAESHAKLYVTAGVYQSPSGKYIRTGNLRNGITHQKEKTENGVTAIVGSPTEYAPYVELGTGIHAKGGRTTPWRYQDEKGNWHTTSGMPARPFIRPAIERHKDEYKDILEQILSE